MRLETYGPFGGMSFESDEAPVWTSSHPVESENRERGVMRCEPEPMGEVKPDPQPPTWAGLQRDKAISAQRALKPQNGRCPACGQRLDPNSQSAPLVLPHN